MRKIKLFVTVLVAFSLMLPARSFAQPEIRGRGSGGCGPQTYNRMYNPQTVETLSGEVVSINATIPMQRMAHGVHLTLKTSEETISVHLGPSWYINNQDIQIQPGDKIEVKGSRIKFANQPALVAAEVKKNDTVLTLRDNHGFPVWSGWRQDAIWMR
ncbi:DNA-binding protein [Scytonema sp. UIC 10036]|uniref:DNA-binding protein n=1 Tax=Scytonema sp. UIC 10036 TaxID=2304196 RepID=UPI0012DA5C40|nr:DNA-binding protein [Scytonema sp. UIC 10036]MUG93570.1 DNA-binding protein [Scytonema sp. UIC 10036]